MASACNDGRGGATSSKGGNTLNEADPSKKHQASQNKGLQPLLRFIEDLINRHIVSEYGDKYTFQFVGGDSKSEKDKIEILKAKAEVALTVNEVRKELGEPPIEGGDTILNGVYVQRVGQIYQQNQYEDAQRKEKLEMMQNVLSSEGEDQNTETTNEQDTEQESNEVGKDGQVKNQTNTNQQGMTTSKNPNNEKPEDFKK